MPGRRALASSHDSSWVLKCGPIYPRDEVPRLPAVTRRPPVRGKAYAAVGDGGADETTAIQAAIATVEATTGAPSTSPDDSGSPTPSPSSPSTSATTTRLGKPGPVTSSAHRQKDRTRRHRGMGTLLGLDGNLSGSARSRKTGTQRPGECRRASHAVLFTHLSALAGIPDLGPRFRYRHPPMTAPVG